MKTILVATDFGPCSEGALKDAFALAATTAAKVHVVHAFSVTRVPGGPERAREALEDAREQAERRMRDLVMPWRGSGLLGEVIVRMGNPKAVILGAARKVGADLIVVGRHQRRSLRRMIFGSLAELLLRRTRARVLVAPPLENGDGSSRDCGVGRPSIEEPPCD